MSMSIREMEGLLKRLEEKVDSLTAENGRMQRRLRLFTILAPLCLFMIVCGIMLSMGQEAPGVTLRTKKAGLGGLVDRLEVTKEADTAKIKVRNSELYLWSANDDLSGTASSSNPVIFHSWTGAAAKQARFVLSNGGVLSLTGDVAGDLTDFNIGANFNASGNGTVGGTLGVTGNTTLSTLSTSGLATLNSLLVSTNSKLNGTLSIIEGGVAPTFYTIFQGGDQAANITYTLPTAQGAANTVLRNDGTGVLSWDTISSGVTTINSIPPDVNGNFSVNGTANQVIVTGGTNSITLSLPQSIATTSSVTFNALTLTNPLSTASGGTGQNSSTWTGVPSVSAGTWTVNASLPVSLGGTGSTSYTANKVIKANGTGTILVDSSITDNGTQVIITSGGSQLRVE